MDLIIRRIIDQRENTDGTWTLLAEAEIAGTVIEECRITLPRLGRDGAEGRRAPGQQAARAGSERAP